MILRYDQGMNTPNEALSPNHPAIESLAREVLAAEKVMDDTPGLLYLDGPTHEHEKAAGAILDAAPALARAVIDLTAQLDAERFAHANTAATVKNVEALADKLDREASEYLGRPVHSQAGDRIRAALNGGDQ